MKKQSQKEQAKFITQMLNLNEIKETLEN